MLRTLGAVYIASGHYAETATLFEEAKDRYPDEPFIFFYLGLGQAQSTRDQKARARESLGRANKLASIPACALTRAMSSSSPSVHMKTPLPCEMRVTGTSRRSASSRTADRPDGPSVLGISIR